MSHPAWVCGLKLAVRNTQDQLSGHTLRGCVDWNLYFIVDFYCFVESHPAWVCGLKLLCLVSLIIDLQCHTLRGCVDWNRGSFTGPSPLYSHTLRGCVDWNKNEPVNQNEDKVTPCVGVWIETMPICIILFWYRVTPCVGVWIETIMPVNPWRLNCHTLRGCVDWNTRITGINCGKCRHTLRGCVDWNFIIGFMNVRHFGSHPAWVCGLKHILNTLQMYKKVTPCVGVWIETMTRWIRV